VSDVGTDSQEDVRAAMAAIWERRSDGTRWRAQEYRRGAGNSDGLVMRRIYLISDPSPDFFGREPDVSVPDLAALRRDFVEPIVYDTVQRPINARHVSLNADGSFTLAYEEGAMDPKNPANVHPPPWRWGDSKIGRKHRLLDANGDAITLAWADDISRSNHDIEVRVANKTIESIIAAAPEMEALLRRLSEHFHGDHDAAEDDIEEVDSLLARIDATKAINQ
jgi:hypothetical protein